MTEQNLLSELEALISEDRNLRTMQIDLLPTLDILERINQEDKTVAYAVEKVIPEVAKAVERIVEAFKKGGRLVYIGAGTSGRLGVLDATECSPTFSVSESMVVALIAGGVDAFTTAAEGAEDNPECGVLDLQQVALTADDVVVGIAASGRTPYVIGGLNYARQVGAATVALTCNPNSAIASIADIAICPVVGPEVLAGSTRLKSGTAQKLILNMLTTTSMICMGKTYENLMVDLNVRNQKLLARAVRIVMQATGSGYDEARQALDRAGNEVKLAILVLLTGMSIDEGRLALRAAAGFLRKAIDDATC
ncbi:MAG: N-acetylmuramic acid 6-phosphate etherase [Phyllobacterium sp.]|uniref:N-acetylmuramic acid 6-phosphate etherase n=1 Tax=Phyllobacterium sp. TaxID=1871046 RepID=UPI0030F0B729